MGRVSADGPTDAEPGDGVEAAPVSAATVSASERVTQRRRRASIREDHVGDAARFSGEFSDLVRRAVPRMLRSPRELASAPLDNREGFLLAHIDGQTSVQALVDISGIPEDELLVLLQRFRRLGIISLT